MRRETLSEKDEALAYPFAEEATITVFAELRVCDGLLCGRGERDAKRCAQGLACSVVSSLLILIFIQA